jgi:hypothetical protein
VRIPFPAADLRNNGKEAAIQPLLDSLWGSFHVEGSIMKRLVAIALPATVIFLVAPGRGQENAPNAEVAKRLERFVGLWRVDTTDKPSKWTPQERKRTELECVSPLLKGRFLLGRGINQPLTQKGLWLMTYDPKTNGYPFWLFTKDVRGGEWSSGWDQAGTTFTGKATDTPPGWTSQAITRVLDAKTDRMSAWMKDESGTLLFSSVGEKTRQPAAAEKEVLAQWTTRQPDAKVPPEMKVLRRLVGSWKTNTLFKPAVWTPQETRGTGNVMRRWVLDGYYLQDTSVNSDGTESISLVTYDPDRKAYRSWWYNSEGRTTKAEGQWDDASATLTYRSDLGDGITARSSAHFLDNDRHEWEVVVTGADGKLYFHGQWHVTRSR